jgi:glycosyltransferase involved in cell wall biosynthesis
MAEIVQSLTRRVSLGIIQTHATQFDGPFFRFLARDPRFDLTVYYTRDDGARVSVDPELARRESWDHDVTSGYRYQVRNGGFKGLVLLLIRALQARHDLIIVSGYTSMAHLVLAMACKLRHIAVGIRSDTTLLYDGLPTVKSRMKKILLPALLRLFDVGHPTGTLAAEYLCHYGMANSALFLFPYNVDNEYLAMMSAKCREERKILRKKMGISEEDFVVLAVLKFIPREDPLTLLGAFAVFQKDVESAHLIMVGDGVLRDQIEAEVKSKYLRNIHLPGYLPYTQLPCFYAIADVFVHPARREPWGVSVNEAMACGLPVIVSNGVGALRDLMVPRETGFIFQAGEATELAEELKQIAKNDCLRKVMSDNAKNLINGKWHYRSTADNLWDAAAYLRSQHHGQCSRLS